MGLSAGRNRLILHSVLSLILLAAETTSFSGIGIGMSAKSPLVACQGGAEGAAQAPGYSSAGPGSMRVHALRLSPDMELKSSLMRYAGNR